MNNLDETRGRALPEGAADEVQRGKEDIIKLDRPIGNAAMTLDGDNTFKSWDPEDARRYKNDV